MKNETDLQAESELSEEEKLKAEEKRRKEQEEKSKASSLAVNTNDSGNSFYSGDNFKITCHPNPDGSYSGFASDGRRLHGKNFEEINNQACQILKQRALDKGEEPGVKYSGNPPNQRKAEIFCRNAIVKFGMVIRASSDMPQDSAFWKDLQANYLQNGGKPEEWERMTRFIPDNLMGRTPEKSAENVALIEKMDRLKNQKKTNIQTAQHQNTNGNVFKLIQDSGGRPL
ncbi:MAG: hypothetical protein IJ770_03430 [Alphaproteobacteria bacterium]|nr:hypothetical protein [Alphaproteobacteria bacterium]